MGAGGGPQELFREQATNGCSALANIEWETRRLSQPDPTLAESKHSGEMGQVHANEEGTADKVVRSASCE